MIASKLDTEADSDHSAMSESLSVTTESSTSSCSQNQETGCKGGMEVKRKVKKLRSIKLVRLPSLRVNTRQPKVQGDDVSVLSSDAASSQQSTEVEMADASPNYMKTTSSSDAKKGSLQVSRTLTGGSTFNPAKSLTRLASRKLRRSLMRKSSGGTDLKMTLKKSRSIGRNGRFQASSLNSKSILSGNDDDRQSSSNSKLNAFLPGIKSARAITRTSSWRAVRMLTQIGSTKRTSMKKVSQVPDSSVERATCSSALKDSKFPNRPELQPGGSESAGISATKVCPYSYCSLHGHHRKDAPSLKRLVSKRRRMLKNQKDKKSEGKSSDRAKRSGSAKKGIQTSQKERLRDPAVQQTALDRRATSSSREVAGFNEDGASSGGSEDISSSVYAAEIMLGEALCSYLHLNLSQDKMSDLSTAESGNAATSPSLEEASGECFKISQKDSKLVSQATSTEGSEGITDWSTNCRAQNLISTFSHPESSGVAEELLDESSSQAADIEVESREIDNVVSPASVTEPPEGETATEESKNKDSAEDCVFPTEDSEPECATSVAHNTQMEKPKHMGLWGLIYQHMVSGIAAEDATQPTFIKVDKEEDQGEDASILTGMTRSGSPLGFPGSNEGMNVEDKDDANQRIHLFQHNAIRLVQEAFDKILSEIPDQSSDDQSVNTDTTSDKELDEKSHGDVGELSLSTSASDTGSTVQDQEETRPKADDTGVTEETKMGDKVKQQAPKGWNNLKKIIILKRFVKALEKVREFAPRKPRFLPVEPDPEQEKVQLRRLSMGDRKNSEEFMLDYALQKVISELAPAQKRKVALLVQAFETMVPLPEIGTHQRSNLTSSHSTPNQIPTDALEAADFFLAKEKVQIHSSELKETSSEHCGIQEAEDASASKIPDTGLKQGVGLNLDSGDCSFNLQDGKLDFLDNHPVETGDLERCDKPSSKAADVLQTSHEETLTKGEAAKDVPKEVSLISTFEVHDRGSQVNMQVLESNDQISVSHEQSEETESRFPIDCTESIAHSGVVSPASVSEQLEKSSEDPQGETKLENKILQDSTPLEESKPSSSNCAANEKQLGKQKHMRLWYLIYKHMVSGTATVLEGADKEEGEADAGTLAGESNARSHNYFSAENREMNMKNHDEGIPKIELEQLEAIRLVEEAIDEIPLPEVQDDSLDDQSVNSEMGADQEDLEVKSSEGSNNFNKMSTVCTKGSWGGSNIKEERSTSFHAEKLSANPENITAQETEDLVSPEGNKPKPRMQKTWSNLKKVILLKRFIKSLERVKTYNPQKPRFLPKNPELESEKVNLRHQDIEDRKNADEWMLDCALQQVVAKLTPVRKRKVGLLVEAFETVIPAFGN